jgi:hypothetical protein
MKFLAILVIVFLYRNWVGNNPLREGLPFEGYARWCSNTITTRNLRYLICVGAPSVLTLIISFQLSAFFLGSLFWLLLALAALVYSIDIHDPKVLFANHTNRLLLIASSASPEEEKRQLDDSRMLITYEIFQGIYPQIFWFLLLGPAGCLFYTLSRLYIDRLDDGDSEIALVDRVVFWMEWPAARITGLVFALVGRFGECMDAWLDSLLDADESIGSLLVHWALAATGTPATSEDNVAAFVSAREYSNAEVRTLLERTLFGWLGVAAVFAVLSF